MPHVLKAKGRFLIEDHETIRNKILLSNISLSLLNREILIPQSFSILWYQKRNKQNLMLRVLKAKGRFVLNR